VADEEDDPINDKPMPLMDHLIELRTRLIWAMAAFGLCFAVSYYFSDRIYFILAQPLANVLRASGNPDPKLVYTQLYEAFFTYLTQLFEQISRRDELVGVAFDRREAARALRLYLGS